jgi:hypothetical protein
VIESPDPAKAGLLLIFASNRLGKVALVTFMGIITEPQTDCLAAAIAVYIGLNIAYR